MELITFKDQSYIVTVKGVVKHYREGLAAEHIKKWKVENNKNDSVLISLPSSCEARKITKKEYFEMIEKQI